MSNPVRAEPGNREVENIHVVEIAVRNVDEGRDRTTQVHQSAESHGRLRGPERGLGKDGQAQIDGGGIECVRSLVQIQAEVFVRVQGTLGRSVAEPYRHACARSDCGWRAPGSRNGCAR